MKIMNRTHWRSDHLRAFLIRVATDELEPSKRKVVTIIVKYNRGGKRHASCSGKATIGGSWAKIMVPSGAVDRVDFAYVIAHEFGHIRGLTHRQMACARYARINDWRARYAWADSLPLEKQTRPVTVRVTGPAAVNCKLSRALVSLKRWQTKAKRAQTGLKKAQAKVRYYEKRLAAVQPAGA